MPGPECISITRQLADDSDAEKQMGYRSSDTVPEVSGASSPFAHQDILHIDEYREQGDEIYERFSPRRKATITCVLAVCAFLAPTSSTCVLAAVPEVAAEYNTTGAIINLSNALYLIFMGVSPILYGPISESYGRRWVSFCCALLFFAFSVGTAAAPDLISFFIFRIATAIQGTAFLIIGASCLGDIYRPVERGTAMGWFLSGTLIGPAFGPFIAGIIVTFRTWRYIFWFQAALGGFATLLVFFLLPETIHQKRAVELQGLSRRGKAAVMCSWVNPWRVIRLYRYPNILAVCFAGGCLVWNMYSLLTPIRYVLNPRFHLTSPIQSGLFYIAPGCGYLVGTIGGGRWADRVVRKNIKRRGERIPEDRLKSSLVSMGIIIPACMLIYGWSVEYKKGGVPLPVVAMFVQGVGQLFCFASLNTYCTEVMPKQKAEAVAANYVLRYVLACTGTGVVLPAIESIGAGGFSTISAGLLVLACLGIYATTVWGRSWREKIDARREQQGANGQV